MEVQRHKDILSIACMNVHAYHNILNQGQMMYVQNDATWDNVSCGINLYTYVMSCQRTVVNFERYIKAVQFLYVDAATDGLYFMM
jgi:hypothetical protein